MKKFILLSFCLSFLIATGFPQTNKLTRYLPANAGMVMSFNPIEIAKKIPGETFRQSAMYREMMKGDDGELRAFLSDPSVCGIDFSENLILVTETDTSSTHSSNIVNVFGVLKNEALFSLAVKKLIKEKESELKIYGNNRILLSGNFGPAIAWNDEIFVFTSGNKNAAMQEMQGLWSYPSDTAVVEMIDSAVVAIDSAYMVPDTVATPTEYEKNMEAITEKLNKMARDHCFELLTPKNNNPFFSHTVFNKLMSETGDIRIWSNGTGMGSGSMKRLPYPVRALMDRLQSLSGDNKTAVINFENGKITGTSRNYITGGMAEAYTKYPSVPLNTSLVRRLPEGKLLALAATSMHPDMMKEMWKKSGLGDLIDSMKGEMPFDASLLNGTFGSNALFAVLSIPENKTNSNEDMEGGRIASLLKGIQIIIAMPLTNKARFEQLKASITKAIQDMSPKEDPAEENNGEKNQAKMLDAFKPVIKYNDSLCVISFSEKVATDFINNNSTGAVPEWLQSAGHHTMLFNLNLSELINTIYVSAGSPTGKGDVEAKQILGMLDKMIITGGDYSNGSVNSKMEFRFTNQNENALKQLFDLINNMAEQKQKAREDDDAAVLLEEKKEETETITIQAINQEGIKESPPPPPPPMEEVRKVPVKKKK
jgi:hypothetical protein